MKEMLIPSVLVPFIHRLRGSVILLRALPASPPLMLPGTGGGENLVIPAFVRREGKQERTINAPTAGIWGLTRGLCAQGRLLIMRQKAMGRGLARKLLVPW